MTITQPAAKPRHSFADDQASVKEKGAPSITLARAYAPFSLANEQNEVVGLVGFDVFIGSEIGKRMEVEPKIVTIAWGGILAGLVTEEGSPVEVFRAPKEARTKAFLKQVFDG